MTKFKEFMQKSIAMVLLAVSSVLVYFYFAVLHVPGFGPTSSVLGGLIVLWVYYGTFTACVNKLFE